MTTATAPQGCFHEWFGGAWLAAADWLSALAHNAAFWNAFWPAIFGAAAGAIIAFRLEQHRRDEERISRELGQCHTLGYTLIHMLSMAEDFREQLFTRFATKYGRLPNWDEIHGLEGAPERGPGFAIKDYAFLLDGRDHSSPAPQLLNKTLIAARNFDAMLDRLTARTRLWHQYDEQRQSKTFSRGEEALQHMSRLAPLSTRIQELTTFLTADISESIADLGALLPMLSSVMRMRYPKRQFIVATPTNIGPQTPSAEVAGAPNA